MKGSQQLLFFYLKSDARFAPFIFVLFPLDFSPTFYGLHKRVTAKYSTIASRKQIMFIGLKPGLHKNTHGIQTWRNPHSTCSYRELWSLRFQRRGGSCTWLEHRSVAHTVARTEGKKSCSVWRSGLKTIKSHKQKNNRVIWQASAASR